MDLGSGPPDPAELEHRGGGGRIRVRRWPVGGHHFPQPAAVHEHARCADLIVEPCVQLVVADRPVERVVGRLDVPVERDVHQEDHLAHGPSTAVVLSLDRRVVGISSPDLSAYLSSASMSTIVERQDRSAWRLNVAVFWVAPLAEGIRAPTQRPAVP